MAPLSFNFARDVVDRLAAHDRVGLIFIDEHGHRRDYTFSEISLHSQRYAGALRALGVQSGERVVMCVANTAKCLFAMLGLERLGAVPVPVPADASAGEIARISRSSGACAIVGDRGRRREADCAAPDSGLGRRLLIGEDAQGWERLDRLAENAAALPGEATYASDPACVLDGITVDRGAIYEAAQTARALYGAGKGDVVWCTMPMGGAQWFANAYVAPWSCEAATILHDAKFDPVERLDLLRELDASILIQSTPEYRAQVNAMGMERFRAPRLNRCFAIGEPVDPQAAGKWKAALNIPIEDAAGGVLLAASSAR